MDVIINGVQYYQKYNIGIAITTRNRHKLLEDCLNAHQKFSPKNAKFLVVDDGSEQPVIVPDWVELFRFEKSQGIATAKNKCLELLEECEHIFLFDDDCYPKVENWHLPYIENPEPHLAHSWNLVKIYEDDMHTVRNLCGGTLLYYENKVIKDTGGMRTMFGRYGGEHVNLSDRIYNRGWTSWRYADVKDSEKLFYELDRYDKSHKSAADKEDFDHNQKVGMQLQRSMIDDNEYVEFRQQESIVITTLLTKVPDPQRGICIQANLNMLDALAKSIKFGHLVVLHDCFSEPEMKTGNNVDVEFIKVENKISPYFGRWLLIYQLLRKQNNRIDFVWAVDATDVEQLRDPFDLEKDTLYMGQEQSTLNNEWLIKNHNDQEIQEFIKQNKDKTLLNPGTLGGDVKTVKHFAHLMCQYWFDGHAKHLEKWKSICGIGEMGAAQIIAYTKFDKLFYGASVNTLFKGEKKDSFARWKHK